MKRCKDNDLVDAHGEVSVRVVVLLHVPHRLIDHREQRTESAQSTKTFFYFMFSLVS